MTATVYGSYGDRFDCAVDASPVTPGFHHSFDGPHYKEVFANNGYVASPMQGNFFTPHDVGSWPSETMSSSLSSDQSSRDFREEEGFFADPGVGHALDHLLGNQIMPSVQEVDYDEAKVKEEPLYQQNLMAHEMYNQNNSYNERAMSSALELSRSIPSLSIGKTPGLRFLINYYDKVISPVIVAFDGPTNPYRTHILKLAQESETLQHAIAALSASNLRMRREHNPSLATQPRLSLTDEPHDKSVRQSSIAHTMLNDDLRHATETKTSPGVPSKEELHHKGESIRALNAQLADPSRRKDDSILATLLILCLYHICDTGVAKFRTQFAGVKKILALRGDHSNSKETAWLKTMFTWFDAMTATVNDREGQFTDFSTNTLFPSTSATEEWALENLAGCDGRLFSTIAKLGRLNLLSQGKAVSESPHSTPKASPQPKTQDYYSMNYSRLDGNGWCAFPADELLPLHAAADGRTQFWAEWSDIRRKLEDWSLDSAHLPPPLHTPALELNRIDLRHISESFRYSALLYTERLAYPHLPSSAPNFQTLVAQALFFISQVKSDVYLLWPLFITGTECVDEAHRGLIRGRCLDIQKDSGFFNNISGLELLERVWRDDDARARELDILAVGGLGACGVEGGIGIGIGGPGRGGEGFKWRRAMEKVDGEYIVI